MPPFPAALLTTWEKFILLGAHRTEWGISFQEIEAFKAATGVYVGCWEAALIIRMSDAALRAWRGEAYQRDHDEELVTQIPVTNTTGVKQLFQGLKERHKAKGKRDTDAESG
jgi:hypothetical protein